MDSKVGIVGVGLMGLGIAVNVARSGRPVAYLAHAGNQDTQQLDELGATAYDSVNTLTKACDTVIICVTGSPQVESVVFGDDGIISGIQAGSTVIDCSTAIPSSTIRVAAAILEAGADFLDAPMTRTPKEAAEGRLNLIVGGNAETLRQQRPLLECFAENIIHAGPVGAGHTMKLIHNFVSLGFSALIAEAAACASQAGISDEALVDVLGNGGGGGVVLERMKPFLLDRDSSGFRFSLANAHKDLSYYLAMSEELETPSSGAHAVKEIYADASGRSPMGTPIPELIEILRKIT